jgi:S-adenosylmethionine-diacylglycerol 3-amino-3-carboxypropyl transferase
MQPDFYKRLSYSFGNEDWRAEQKALRIKSGDRVLCVTASGDRPLHLLLDDCAELISVDTNVIQNNLLNLKKAAMQQLSYEEYLGFLGAKAGQNRLDKLKEISKEMDHEAARYWLKHPRKIEKGILYQGAVEKVLRKLIGPTLRVLRRKKLKKLFEFKKIEEQREFVKKEWDTFAWRKTFDLVLCPPVSKMIWNDPGLHLHVDPSFRAGSYIYQRMHNSLLNTLARENLMVSLILKGDVQEDAYPAYLTKEGVKTIKPRLNRLKTVTSDLISYIENAPENSIDCFSLSDVASFLSPQNFERLLRAVLRAAKPGARVSIREFLSHHTFPEELKVHFLRNPQLEKELENEDCCFVYRFISATVTK